MITAPFFFFKLWFITSRQLLQLSDFAELLIYRVVATQIFVLFTLISGGKFAPILRIFFRRVASTTHFCFSSKLFGNGEKVDRSPSGAPWTHLSRQIQIAQRLVPTVGRTRLPPTSFLVPKITTGYDVQSGIHEMSKYFCIILHEISEIEIININFA